MTLLLSFINLKQQLLPVIIITTTYILFLFLFLKRKMVHLLMSLSVSSEDNSVSSLVVSMTRWTSLASSVGTFTSKTTSFDTSRG